MVEEEIEETGREMCAIGIFAVDGVSVEGCFGSLVVFLGGEILAGCERARQELREMEEKRGEVEIKQRAVTQNKSPNAG